MFAKRRATISAKSLIYLFNTRQNITSCTAYPFHTSVNKTQNQVKPFSKYDEQDGGEKPKSSTFVSAHFQLLDEKEILDVLNRFNMQHKIVGEEYVIKECPFCHPIKNQVSNMWKLQINRFKGFYHCFRCNETGSWYDFRSKLGHNSFETVVQPVQKYTKAPKDAASTPFSNISDAEIEAFRTNLPATPEVVEFLAKRKISLEVAQKYNVGCSKFKFFNEETKAHDSHMCITFPMYKVRSKGKSDPVRHKIRSITNKQHMRLAPNAGMMGFFGWNLVPEDAKEIIITEGEFDAMCVYQQTGRPTISLPNGCRSLPVDLLPMLERFEKIYLWMDDDAPGQDGADTFSQKLGLARTYIVHSSLQHNMTAPNAPKDANEALLKGIDFDDLLAEAQPQKHGRIIVYDDQMKSEIYRELYDPSNEVTGVKSVYFPKLNGIVKGLRRGEITLFTGPTGIGKTTILSQLSLDFASQGVSTLWGSFEIKNQRLIKKMLCQLAGKDMTQHRNEFEHYSDKFQQLPLYFLNFYGSTNVDQVLDAVDYASYVHDVQHVVLDNLQFMMSGQALGYEKFDLQDRIMEKFRNAATRKNIHISLVIHPRKVDDEQQLGLSSVFGTAKATQEADNVLIVQRGANYRFLSVKKNRFSGDLGDVPYKYEKGSSRIIELTDDQVKQADSGALKLSY